MYGITLTFRSFIIEEKWDNTYAEQRYWHCQLYIEPCPLLSGNLSKTFPLIPSLERSSCLPCTWQSVIYLLHQYLKWSHFFLKRLTLIIKFGFVFFSFFLVWFICLFVFFFNVSFVLLLFKITFAIWKACTRIFKASQMKKPKPGDSVIETGSNKRCHCQQTWFFHGLGVYFWVFSFCFVSQVLNIREWWGIGGKTRP